MAYKDLTGKTFGNLTAIRTEGRLHGSALWYCECICGGVKVVRGDRLMAGRTRSCGCLYSTSSRTHGESGGEAGKSPEYKAWGQMKTRCLNPNNPHWQDYGGRGIKISELWLNSYEQFLKDVGRRPEGVSSGGRALYSLDRWPNKNGNYEPGNVRWATNSEQGLNRRRIRAVTGFTDQELLEEIQRRVDDCNVRILPLNSALVAISKITAAKEMVALCNTK